MLSEIFMYAMTDISDSDIDAVGEILGYKNKLANRQRTMPLRRALLIAAIVAAFLALSVTAYATGFFGLRDLLLGNKVTEYAGVDPATGIIENYDKMDSIGLTEVPVTVVSLQGLQGTPEYLANQEWQAFWNDYKLNNHYGEQVPNPAINTDPWFKQHERIYLAYTPVMKDKLLEICDKYSLKPLDNYIYGEGTESLYSFLGIENVLNEKAFENQQFRLDTSALLGYDAGTFRFQFEYDISGVRNGGTVSLDLTRAAKGYLHTGIELFNGEENLTEWSYTNLFGNVVSIILGPRNAVILSDGEHAFVSLGANFPFFEQQSGGEFSKEMLEEIADLVNFDVLGHELPNKDYMDSHTDSKRVHEGDISELIKQNQIDIGIPFTEPVYGCEITVNNISTNHSLADVGLTIEDIRPLVQHQQGNGEKVNYPISYFVDEQTEVFTAGTKLITITFSLINQGSIEIKEDSISNGFISLGRVACSEETSGNMSLQFLESVACVEVFLPGNTDGTTSFLLAFFTDEGFVADGVFFSASSAPNAEKWFLPIETLN